MNLKLQLVLLVTTFYLILGAASLIVSTMGFATASGVSYIGTTTFLSIVAIFAGIVTVLGFVGLDDARSRKVYSMRGLYGTEVPFTHPVPDKAESPRTVSGLNSRQRVRSSPQQLSLGLIGMCLLTASVLAYVSILLL